MDDEPNCALPAFRFDLDKMKRWHGRPPIWPNQSERDFDKFILALAACVRYGDAVTECLVYRYGLEKWKAFHLISEQQKLMLIEHRLHQEFEERDSKRQKHREVHEEDSTEGPEAIREFFDKFTVSDIVDEHTTHDYLRLLHYKHEIDELALVPKINASLRLLTHISSSIDSTMSRLADLERQLALHHVFLAEKFDQQLLTLGQSPDAKQ